MATNCQLADRTSIRAFRAGKQILIVAEGELPTPGFTVDIAPSPLRIFPQQFNLLRCPKPGIWPQVVTPYRVAETFAYPEDQPKVTVHHAEGTDQVTIEDCGTTLSTFADTVRGDAGKQCPPGSDQATGLSRNLSFEEAFAKAVANLPPVQNPVPDALTRVEVVEIGGLFGGIAGFRDLFVRICRTTDA